MRMREKREIGQMDYVQVNIQNEGLYCQLPALCAVSKLVYVSETSPV